MGGLIKNLVLIGAGLVIGATVRGGRLVADPAEIRDNDRARGGLSPQPVRFGRFEK